ncbi:hypothetical protein HD806DRAFT_521718 [Xylariaceae sp. AK1471]|nr:hypothetical protein HD806DRAFT_521718 [Xylariaceae sp. AK1471]
MKPIADLKDKFLRFLYAHPFRILISQERLDLGTQESAVNGTKNSGVENLGGSIHVQQNAGKATYISGTVWDLWTFQCIAGGICIISFVTLVSIASVYADRPLSDWPSGLVPITSVVAALTTIMKGTLMVPTAASISQARWAHFSSGHEVLRDLESIDEASRGPWGSFQWITRHPRNLSLINFGSLVTLLATALSTFTQQSVSIGIRKAIDATGSAHVSWVQNLNAVDRDSWTAAVYDGVFQPEVGDLPVDCSSGDCSWPVVPTLGVCAKCVDVSKDARTSTSPLLCNYTHWATTLSNAPPPNSTLDLKSFMATLDLLNRCEGESQPTYMDTFTVIEIPITKYDPTTQFASFGSHITTECILYPCIQRITTNVVFGNTEQSLQWGGADAPCMSTEEPDPGDITLNDEPQLNTQGHKFVFNATAAWMGTSKNDIPRIGPLLQARQDAVINLEATNYYYLTTAKNAEEYANKLFANPERNPFMKQWHDTRNNRTQWLSKLAKSLSNTVRQTNRVPPDQDVYAGTAYKEEAYIRVSWPWIAYPATLVVLSLILFCLNVIVTLRHSHGVWGNGSIPLLLSSVDGSVKAQAEGAYGSLNSLVAAVGASRVQLAIDTDRAEWTLKETQ